jgi:hypothetical protein
VGDPFCYARSGKMCEGYLSYGCRHCGRIITLALIEEQNAALKKLPTPDSGGAK